MISKKSQMEILGLAIVVVLILVGTIFVVKFIALKPQTNYRSTFISSQLASNWVNTFMRTSPADCPYVSEMKDLIQDCAQGSNIICNNGEDSCEYVGFTADKIINQSLAKWRYKHEFMVYTDLNTPLVKIGSRCTKEKKSKLFPIPLGYENANVFVKLDICSD